MTGKRWRHASSAQVVFKRSCSFYQLSARCGEFSVIREGNPELRAELAVQVHYEMLLFIQRINMVLKGGKVGCKVIN
jgi:hypothetical protein